MHSLQHISQKLLMSQDIVILTHESPDGDCLGSALALSAALQQLRIKNQIINKDRIPDNFSFLKGSEKITLPSAISTVDTMVFLDCADIDRIGFDCEEYFPNANLKVNIDHHISNTAFGNFFFIRPDAAATGELIYELLSYLPIVIDDNIATALYTSLVTDTGSFKYDNVTSKTLKIASQLLEEKANKKIIYEQLFDNKSLKFYKLLVEVLNNLDLNKSKNIAWAYIDKQKIASLEIEETHLNGIVNYTKSIENVDLGIFFKEYEENKIKVSFRSNDAFDSNLLASKFSGGGHKKAAGCKIEGKMQEVIKKVIEVAESLS